MRKPQQWMLQSSRNCHLQNLPWSNQGSLASQGSFIFIFIWLFPLSELSSWQAFCICQVMPLEMSLWAQQQPPCLHSDCSPALHPGCWEGLCIHNQHWSTHTQWHIILSSLWTWLEISFFVICNVENLMPNLICTWYCHEIFSYHSDPVCSVNSIRLNVKIIHLKRSFELQFEINYLF